MVETITLSIFSIMPLAKFCKNGVLNALTPKKFG